MKELQTDDMGNSILNPPNQPVKSFVDDELLPSQLPKTAERTSSLSSANSEPNEKPLPFLGSTDEQINDRKQISRGFILVVLFILFSIALWAFASPMIQAGVYVAQTVASLIMPITLAYGIWRFGFQQIPALDNRELSYWRPVIILALLLSGLLLISQTVHNLVGQQLYNDAVRTNSMNDAQTFLEAAQKLGFNVAEPLQNKLLEELHHPNSTDEQVLHLARLMQQYGKVDTALLTIIRDDIDLNRASENIDRMKRSTRVLATLDLTAAAQLAADFNDKAVLAQQSEKLKEARYYLEIVRILEEYDIGRTPKGKSITLLNLGQLREQTSTPENALEAYQAAWEIDPENYEAAYAYSVLILAEQESSTNPDVERLRTAENMARQATRLLNCDTNVNDLCFLLLTTRAGIGLLLQTDPSTLSHMVDRAISIAETTKHFSQLPYAVWTAEPYYYKLLLNNRLEVETEPEILCNIVRHHNPDPENLRHKGWADAANRELTARHLLQTCTED